MERIYIIKNQLIDYLKDQFRNKGIDPYNKRFWGKIEDHIETTLLRGQSSNSYKKLQKKLYNKGITDEEEDK